MQRQFLVPQFIDVEDKIIGPITTRQFVLMLVATLFIFIEYLATKTWLFIIEGFLTAGIFGILAFMKINGMPFHFFLLNLFQTGKRPQIRIWNKTLKDSELLALIKLNQEPNKIEEKFIPKTISTSNLSKLSLIVNTGGTYRGEDDDTLFIVEGGANNEVNSFLLKKNKI